MKKFEEYIEAIRPQGTMHDRSLESFRSLLDQMKMSAKAILNPEAKKEIYEVLVPFTEQMREILFKYKQQGIGYNKDYQANNYSSDNSY